MDIYKPSEWTPGKIQSFVCNSNLSRSPKPPMWLLAVAKDEGYNYYKFCRFLQKKVGGIGSGDISRFGKSTVLIHAKSKTQSRMLSLLQAKEKEMLKEVRPHQSFSYGKGVIFDRDLYEMTENEILDMSPSSVWRVKKTYSRNMIILTFEDENIPSQVVFENEIIKVRPYHQKPMQCFNCFKFGHTAKICIRTKVCVNCSAAEHGECLEEPKCNNCSLAHKSIDKSCEQFKLEQAAINKASSEHISVSYAKRLMGHYKTYARALKPLPQSSKSTAKVSPVIPAPVIRVNNPVVVAQSSGSDALLGQAKAHSSMTGNQPRVGNETSSKDEAPLSPTTQVLSQAESLPDLMDYEQRRNSKRGRNPSSSPPSSRNKLISICDSRDELDSAETISKPDTTSVKPKKKSFG